MLNKTMIDINFILTVLIQVVCIFIFLCAFYFTYASKMEGKIVENQVKFLINDIAQHNLHTLPDDKKDILINKLNSIDSNTPENKIKTDKIDASNKQLIDKTKKIGIILSILIVIMILISFYLYKKGTIPFFKNLNLIPILKETGIILLFIALTEYIFVTYFAAEFISIRPNILKAQIAENISNSF